MTGRCFICGAAFNLSDANHAGRCPRCRGDAPAVHGLLVAPSTGPARTIRLDDAYEEERVEFRTEFKSPIRIGRQELVQLLTVTLRRRSTDFCLQSMPLSELPKGISKGQFGVEGYVAVNMDLFAPAICPRCAKPFASVEEIVFVPYFRAVHRGCAVWQPLPLDDSADRPGPPK